MRSNGVAYQCIFDMYAGPTSQIAVMLTGMLSAPQDLYVQPMSDVWLMLNVAACVCTAGVWNAWFVNAWDVALCMLQCVE